LWATTCPITVKAVRPLLQRRPSPVCYPRLRRRPCPPLTSSVMNPHRNPNPNIDPWVPLPPSVLIRHPARRWCPRRHPHHHESLSLRLWRRTPWTNGNHYLTSRAVGQGVAHSHRCATRDRLSNVKAFFGPSESPPTPLKTSGAPYA
jgi:hypothetical protein